VHERRVELTPSSYGSQGHWILGLHTGYETCKGALKQGQSRSQSRWYRRMRMLRHQSMPFEPTRRSMIGGRSLAVDSAGDNEDFSKVETNRLEGLRRTVVDVYEVKTLRNLASGSRVSYWCLDVES